MPEKIRMQGYAIFSKALIDGQKPVAADKNLLDRFFDDIMNFTGTVPS